MNSFNIYILFNVSVTGDKHHDSVRELMLNIECVRQTLN
jgi:hypothetical protein